jgi:hypothetical protein
VLGQSEVEDKWRMSVYQLVDVSAALPEAVEAPENEISEKESAV